MDKKIQKEQKESEMSSGMPTSQQTPTAPTPVTPAVAYYAMVAGQQIGPMTTEQLGQMAANGQVTDGTPVWTEGMPQWQTYGQVKQTSTVSHKVDVLKEKGKLVTQKMAEGLAKANQVITTAADLHKLENFSWKKFLGAIFRKHPDEDVYEIFQCGTPNSTPTIDQVTNEWPAPWLFSRFLFFGIALFAVFAWLLLNKGIGVLAPFYCLTAALFFPLALYILFYELNIWRNVSMYNAARCFVVGGVVALVLLVLKSEKFNDWYIQAPLVEYIKLQAALLVGAHLAKMRMNRILPGMLMGCAVGGGLSVIIYTGNVFSDVMDVVGNNELPDPTIVVVVCLMSFLDVIWAVITVGAFCKVQALREHEHGQGEAKYNKTTMFDKRFLCIAAVPLILHFGELWMVQGDTVSPLKGVTFLVVLCIFSIISWWIAMRLIQRGIDQVREEKELALAAATAKEQPSGQPPAENSTQASPVT